MRRIKENKPFAVYKGRKMIDTHHAIERNALRRENLIDYPNPKDYVKEHIRIMQEGIETIIKKYNDVTGIYILFSKSTHLGLVIEWREDYWEKDGKNHAIVVTVLPKKDRVYKKYPTDTIVFTEAKRQLFDNFDMIDAMLGALIESTPEGKRQLTENTSSDTVYHFTTKYGFEAYMVDGEFTAFNVPYVITS